MTRSGGVTIHHSFDRSSENMGGTIGPRQSVFCLNDRVQIGGRGNGPRASAMISRRLGSSASGKRSPTTRPVVRYC